MGVVEDGGQRLAGAVEGEGLFDEFAFAGEGGAFKLDAEGFRYEKGNRRGTPRNKVNSLPAGLFPSPLWGINYNAIARCSCRALPTDVTRSVVQVKVSARHGHLNEVHKQEISAKAEKLLHFFDRILMIEVTVDLAGLEKKVEIIASVEHHEDFVAHSQDPDVMVAVNATVDKLKQQIKHHKDLLHDHRRDPSHGGPAGIKP